MKLHCEPGYLNRTWQSADWFDENNIFVMHERTYVRTVPISTVPISRRPLTPAQLHWASSGDMTTHYWITNAIYTDKYLGEKEVSEFKGNLQEGFYCERPDLHWFPIFQDFELALKYLKYKTGILYKSK